MRFEDIFAYENRGMFQTSNWSLEGIDTRDAGNCSLGRLWMKCSQDSGAVTVELYSGWSCDAQEFVAGGSFSQSPGWCELTARNESGISGSVYFEFFGSAPLDAVEVVVSLCGDADLGVYYNNLGDLPVYSDTAGMSDYCAQASTEVLSRVSRMYSDELGLGADYRLICNLDSLKVAAVHCALALAFGACHESASQTMYSQLRDWHGKQMLNCMESLNLSFRSSGDYLDGPVYRRSANIVRIQRG